MRRGVSYTTVIPLSIAYFLHLISAGEKECEFLFVIPHAQPALTMHGVVKLARRVQVSAFIFVSFI